MSVTLVGSQPKNEVEVDVWIPKITSADGLCESTLHKVKCIVNMDKLKEILNEYAEAVEKPVTANNYDITLILGTISLIAVITSIALFCIFQVPLIMS